LANPWPNASLVTWLISWKLHTMGNRTRFITPSIDTRSSKTWDYWIHCGLKLYKMLNC
jgi:hypothetical protein